MRHTFEETRTVGTVPLAFSTGEREKVVEAALWLACAEVRATRGGATRRENIDNTTTSPARDARQTRQTYGRSNESVDGAKQHRWIYCMWYMCMCARTMVGRCDGQCVVCVQGSGQYKYIAGYLYGRRLRHRWWLW